MRFASWAIAIVGYYVRQVIGGLVWTLRYAGGGAGYTSVAYLNNILVAVSPASGVAIRSTDEGVSWAPVDHELNASRVVEGVTHFLAMTTGFGGPQRSVDGVTWDAPTTWGAVQPDALACGGGVCVAYAMGGNYLQTSADDGDVWTPQTTPSGFSPCALVYGNGVFICCVNSGNTLRSADGVNWSVAGAPPVPSGNFIVAYGPIGWVAMATDTAVYDVWLSTDDCATWSVIGTRPAGLVYSLRFGAGLWLAASIGGAYRSTDGATWELIDGGLSDDLGDWRDTAVSSDYFVIVGASTLNTVRTSPLLS